jgi:RNA polymerase sigma factor (sigma-70 family)
MNRKMDMDDSDLLEDHARGAGNHSFRQFVQRYQNMVYSTALRRTGDPGQAEEVAQDVFLFVAEKAPLLVRHPSLAGWLYNTTLKKAANRMKQETRRKLREGRFAEEAGVSGGPGAAPAEAYAMVDEALAALDERDREALVLRFFQDLDLEAVGRAQGATAEAARKRVDRSLEKLRHIFRRKGVAIPSTSALVAVLAGSTQPAPAMLLASATAAAAATAPGVPSLTTYLFHHIIIMSKTQIVACALALAAVSVGVRQVAFANRADEAPEVKSQTAGLPMVQPAEAEQSNPVAAAPPPEIRPAPDDRVKAMAELEATVEAGMAYMLRMEEAGARSKVKSLVAALGLDGNQAALIERRALANVAREHERQSEKMAALGKARGNLEKIQRISESSREIGLFDGIEQDLETEQLERFGEWTKAEEEAGDRKLAETRTYLDMEELQTSVPLSGEKQAAVFAILLAENEAVFLGPDEEPLDPGTAEPFKRNQEQRLQERMRRLSEVLTEEEMANYRKHLEEDEMEFEDEDE